MTFTSNANHTSLENYVVSVYGKELGWKWSVVMLWDNFGRFSVRREVHGTLLPASQASQYTHPDRGQIRNAQECDEMRCMIDLLTANGCVHGQVFY